MFVQGRSDISGLQSCAW